MVSALVAIAVISQMQPTRELGISLGPGFSFYGGDQRGPIRDIDATGVYARGDYVFRTTAWFAPRIYAGTLGTRTELYTCRGAYPCDMHANVFFAGGAFRFILPVPWIAPWVEVGGGPSFGRIETRYGPAIERGHDGMFAHFDFGVGLAIGRYHQLEVGLQMLDHPQPQNVGGGLTIGLRFPL